MSVLSPALLQTLTHATSAEAMLLQLGHADGAFAFSDEKDDFSFDSSARGPSVALSPAQLALLQASLSSGRIWRNGGMPHDTFHAHVGFRIHGANDELRIVVGLDELARAELSAGSRRQVIIARQERNTLLTLATELFGADAGVAQDVLAPGHTVAEFYQGRHETY